MTDRYHSLTVVLERNIRSDDAEPLIAAIKMLRGVLSVKPVVVNLDSHMAEERARREVATRILEFTRTWHLDAPSKD